MLLGLSSLMRATHDRPPDHLVTLATELDFVKQYLDLQSARFGDRLTVQYDVSDGARQVLVPSFLLQPLVENALRHGVARRPGRCSLEIAARLVGDRLRLMVGDDGAGLTPGFDLSRDAGTGLRNIRGRLQQLFGSSAWLTVEPRDGGGTIVEVAIPASGSTRARASA